MLSAFNHKQRVARLASVVKLVHWERTPPEKRKPGRTCEASTPRAWLPVIRCGEGCQHDIAPIDTNHVRDRLEYVKIKMRVSRNRAVEASLQERRPLFLQDSLRPSHVILTHLSHSRKDYLQRKHTGDNQMHGMWRDCGGICLSSKTETQQGA